MRSLLLAAGLTAMAVSPSWGEIIGAGAASCAEFARDYKRSPELAERQFFAWAQGFLSGVNKGLEVSKGRTLILDSTPIDRQREIIRRYCDEHPLSTFDSAVWEIAKTLKRVPLPQSN